MRSPPLAGLGHRQTTLVAVGDKVMLFEIERTTSAFSSTPVETLWMRHAPVRDLATAPRVRITDSLGLGRPLDALDAFARGDRAYVMLASNDVGGVIVIEPDGKPRSLPNVAR